MRYGACGSLKKYPGRDRLFSAGCAQTSNPSGSACISKSLRRPIQYTCCSLVGKIDCNLSRFGEISASTGALAAE